MEVEVEAEGLQRSTTSFRRSGSSGLVWNDKLLSRDQTKREPENPDATVRSVQTEPKAYKTNRVVNPAAEPPSPRVSGCGLCGALFGRSNKSQNTKFAKRKS